MEKYIAKLLLSFILLALIGYLLACFYEAKFNIADFDKNTRLGISIIIAFLWVFSGFGILMESKNKN